MTSGAPSEPDPLQAQYDGIPVPCYTWRLHGDDFRLERANRAAFERADGRLEALIGRRLDQVFPDGDPIADLPATVRVLPGSLRVVAPR